MTDDPTRRDDDPDDPFAAMLRNLMSGGQLDPAALSAMGLPSDPAVIGQLMAQVQQMMSAPASGAVNWSMADDVARRTAATGGDPVVGEVENRAVIEALHVVGMWLGQHTELPDPGIAGAAWSRAQWVEKTASAWHEAVEPIADSVADEIAKAAAEQVPPEMKAMMSGDGGMLRQVGGAVFGLQVGQAIGHLASEVLSAHDIGLPLVQRAAALVPTNVAAFAEGLEVPTDEVRLYLAARESAHARLFANVAWLREALLGGVADYARGITIDTGKIQQAATRIDPSNPEALQEALSEGLFEVERTPSQQAALDRLETALALVEGWVDDVVSAATEGRLPHAAALRETMRRRRAAGGPAEHTFASLVGLELRPRRLRDAAAVWAALRQIRGVDGRDAVWGHPDLMPTAADLDHPEDFARGLKLPQSDDLDAELEKLLSADGDHPASGDGDDGQAGPAGTA